MGSSPRWFLLFAWLLCAAPAAAWAQDPPTENPQPAAAPAAGSPDAWPIYATGNDKHAFQRGPGGYISWFKLLTLFLFTAVWVRLCDWVNRDCRTIGLPYAMWNPIAVFPFLGVMLLVALTLPFYFFFNFILLLASIAAPVAVYIVMRNKKVQPHERVLTPDHFRHILSRKAGAVGVKVSAEKKAAHQQGPAIDLSTMPTGDSQRDQSFEIQARNSPGYVPLKQLIVGMLERRAERVMLDYTREGVTVKYEIDGVWHAGEPREREGGDALLASLKKLCQMNPEERRARQSGGFLGKQGKLEVVGLVESQGTQTGERAIVTLKQGVEYKTLEELGMPETVEKFTTYAVGIVLVTGPKACGKTTTLASMVDLIKRKRSEHIITI